MLIETKECSLRSILSRHGSGRNIIFDHNYYKINAVFSRGKIQFWACLLLLFFLLSSVNCCEALEASLSTPSQVEVCRPETYRLTIASQALSEDDLAAHILLPKGFNYAGNSHLLFRGYELPCEPVQSGGSLTWELGSPLAQCRGIVINEFEQNPPGPDGGAEWVEIFNPAAHEMDVGDWRLVDSYYGKTVKFPSGARISPGGHLILAWSNGSLINSRPVSIILYNSAGAEVDRTLEGKDQEDDDRCWSRNPDGKDQDLSSDWSFQASTRGSPNGGARSDLYPGESLILKFNLTAGCEALGGRALRAEVTSNSGSVSSASLPLNSNRANLSLTVVPDRFEVACEDRATWTIEISNPGNGTAIPVLANVTLGRGLVLESIDCPGRGLNWSYPALQPGQKEVVRLRVRAVEVADYWVALQASWGCGPCQNVLVRSELDQRTAIQKLPDSSAAVAIGDRIDFRIVADLPKGARDLWINDSLSSGLIYQESSLAISGAVVEKEIVDVLQDGSAQRSWFFGNAESARRVEIRYQANAENILENQAGTVISGGAAVMSWSDPSGTHIDRDSAGDLTIVEPDLVVEKMASSSAAGPGSEIVYTLSIFHSSQSSAPAFDVDLCDELPNGLQYCPGSAQVQGGPPVVFEPGKDLTWHFEAVGPEWNPNSKIVIKYNASVADAQPGDVLESIARLSWSSISGPSSLERDGSGGINDYLRTAGWAVNAIRLWIAKSASPDPVGVGEPLTYTLVYENQGAVAAKNVTIRDQLDSGAILVSADPPMSTNDGWSIAELPADGRHQIEIQVRARDHLPNGTLLENRYSIECDGLPPVRGALYTEVLNRSRLQANKTASRESVARGEEVNYLITVCNQGGEPATNVTVQDLFDQRVEQIWCWPPQVGPGIWRFPALEPGKCVRMELTILVPRADASFSSHQGVKGTGFMNVYQDFSTAEKPLPLTNRIYVRSDEGPLISDSAKVMVVGEAGTSLSIREHGSGRFNRAESLTFLSSNKSISWSQESDSFVRPFDFRIPGMDKTGFNSSWSRSVRARNGITGTCFQDFRSYSSRLFANARVFMDKNGSEIHLISDFRGMSHLQMKKQSSSQSFYPGNWSFSASDSLLGDFTVFLSLEEQGQSVHWDRSCSGQGLVAEERRIGQSQGSSEAGAGKYQSSEQIRTETSFLSKEVLLSAESVQLGSYPACQFGGDMPWREEMWSKSENSYIGEAYSSIAQLKKKTVFGGLNQMESDAEFSGKSSFRAASGRKDNHSVEVDQVLAGEYRIERNILLTGVSRFDRPHLSITKEGRLLNETVSGYNITILNDGSSALGPVYVKDLFPAGARFLNSSLKPYQSSNNSSTWALTYLSIGSSLTIEVVLDISRCQDPFINCAYASGGYGDQWVTAENCTTLGAGWLGCSPLHPAADMEECSDSSDHCSLAEIDFLKCSCDSDNHGLGDAGGSAILDCLMD